MSTLSASCVYADLSKLGVDDIEDELEVIIGAVARHLAISLNEAVSRDELTSWAGLGVSGAIDKFDPDKIDHVDHRTRVIHYLIEKGGRLAYDYMRASRIIGRVRKGKVYGGPIAATQLSQIPHDHNEFGFGISSGAILDESACDPADIVAVQDFMETITSLLTDSEREVFELHYIQDMPFQEIANAKGVTGARIYQIHSKILRKVREYLMSKGITFARL
ncbi:MAG: sigma-70 family RNA polymerase sigma factor [Phycisphaerales bacterium]|nr:sigma-70 family RNA polymerase sigma factor [Phycisphaerales bacterium]